MPAPNWAHYLSPNKRTTMPEHLIFTATSTQIVKRTDKRVVSSFSHGYACYQRLTDLEGKDPAEWITFSDPARFWQWLDQQADKTRHLYVFDVNVLGSMLALDGFYTLETAGWELSFWHEHNATQIFEWKRDRRTVTWLSTRNFMRGALPDLAQMVDIPWQRPPDWGDDHTIAEATARQAAEITRQVVLKYLRFLTDNDLGAFRVTLSAQSMAAFRHRFLDHSIFIHRDPAAAELEELGYFGGRCEVFQIGTFTKSAYYQLDVNQMYVSLMRDCYVPTSLSRVMETCTLEQLIRALRTQGCIADVELETTEPAFPIRYENRNIYPIGRFRTVLTTPEVLYALAGGMIREIHSVAFYKMRPAFTRYAEWVHGKRREYQDANEPVYAALVKLMGNSLYGKFGQHNIVETKLRPAQPGAYYIEYVRSPETGEEYRIVSIGGWIRKLERGELSFNSCVAIPAHITAYGRLKLWRYIKKAGRNHVFSCDTDGLIVDAVGYKRLQKEIRPGDLGFLKVVGETDKLTVYSRKDYVFGDDTKLKGVPRDAVALGTNDFEYQATPGLKSLLRNKDLRTIYTSQVLKHTKRSVRDGEIDEHGRISPFEIGTDRK